jgi:steroid delta-isomerase-like uncharacterized protein
LTDLSPEGTVRGYFDALNARDYARAAGAIAEHCHWQSMGSESVFRGPAAIVAGLREFVTSFPDWHVELERVTVAGEVVVVEWKTTGTFEKPFRGREPNGKGFRRLGCAIADTDRGLIVRYRDYYDRVTLLKQLDLMDLL